MDERSQHLAQLLSRLHWKEQHLACCLAPTSAAMMMQVRMLAWVGCGCLWCICVCVCVCVCVVCVCDEAWLSRQHFCSSSSTGNIIST